jgi:hypothetical protein
MTNGTGLEGWSQTDRGRHHRGFHQGNRRVHSVTRYPAWSGR